MADQHSLLGLQLQRPGHPGWTLLDAIAHAADGARDGGGVFAFASMNGVKTLLGPDGPLADVAEFELVVGIDAITDERALDMLETCMADRTGLTVRVLLHEDGTLFHPKFTWYRGTDGTTLIVGSGNLTPGGLSGNHEAFYVTTIAPPDDKAATDQIEGWLAVFGDALPRHPQSREDEQRRRTFTAQAHGARGRGAGREHM